MTVDTRISPAHRRGFHERVEEGSTLVHVAAFRSGGTMRLSRAGLPVAVVAVTDAPDVYASRMSRRWYGAVMARESGDLPWDVRDAAPPTVTFERFQMDQRWMGGAPFPAGMTIDDGMVSVELAPGARLHDFAAGLPRLCRM